MSKTTLLAVGILLVLLGIVGMIPAWTLTSEPQWYAIIKIVLGLISIYISRTDR